jgi:hypothetical protein
LDAGDVRPERTALEGVFWATVTESEFDVRAGIGPPVAGVKATEMECGPATRNVSVQVGMVPEAVTVRFVQLGIAAPSE